MQEAANEDGPGTKRACRWVTRAEAVAALALAVILIVWVALILMRQHTVGKEVRAHTAAGATHAYRVNLNTAGPQELTLLPGIGPKRAERIVNWRDTHGPFRSLDEVRKATGLSANAMKRLKESVTLGTGKAGL